MKIDKIDFIHIALIVLLYIVCFGAYNFVNVPFWDDWVFGNYGVDGLWELFRQVGRREHYFMTAPFIGLGSPMIWSVTSFVCWGLVAAGIYFILRLLDWAKGNSLWAALLTAAAPLSQSRFALAMTPYAINAAFFVVSLVLLLVSVRRRNPYARVAAALFLVLSFSTNSFLVMAWIGPALVFLALMSREPGRPFMDYVRGTFLHLELFLLPVAYWVSKALFQPVYGLYANYNKFQMGPIEGLVRSVLNLIAQIPNRATLLVFFPAVDYFIEGAIVALIVIAVGYLLFRHLPIDWRTEKGGWKANWLWVGGFLIAAILALFPYAMVGIRPMYFGLWETRHQTTLAIVGGTLGFVVLRAVLPARTVPIAASLVLAVFISIDVSASRQLLNDVFESNAIVNSPEIADIPPGTIVGVFENDRAYRMFSRHFQFYDLSSMLNATRENDTLAAMSNFEFLDPETNNYAVPGSKNFMQAVDDLCSSTVGLPQYGFGDVVANGTYAEVVLAPVREPPGLIDAWGNAFGFLIDRQSTVERALSSLDIQIRTTQFPEAKCGLQ